MPTMTRDHWEQRAATLDLPGAAYIDGAQVDVASGATFPSVIPPPARS